MRFSLELCRVWDTLYRFYGRGDINAYWLKNILLQSRWYVIIVHGRFFYWRMRWKVDVIPTLLFLLHSTSLCCSRNGRGHPHYKTIYSLHLPLECYITVQIDVSNSEISVTPQRNGVQWYSVHFRKKKCVFPDPMHQLSRIIHRPRCNQFSLAFNCFLPKKSSPDSLYYPIRRSVCNCITAQGVVLNECSSFVVCFIVVIKCGCGCCCCELQS